MIDDGEAKEIKRDYLEILESLLKGIYAQATKKGLDPSKDIHIYSSTSKVYQGAIGEQPDKNLLTPKMVENLREALSNPKNSQGAISIKIGQEKVFHIKNGEVLTDKLGLTSPSQVPKVTTKERVYSVEALQKQVAVLQSKLQAQQKLVDSLKETQQTPESLSKLIDQVAEMGKSLEKQQQLIENTQKALSQMNERFLPQAKNTKLQNWVGAIENKVKQTAKNVFEKVLSVLTPDFTKLRGSITQQKAQLAQQVDALKTELRTQVSGVKSTVNKKIDNARTEFRSAVDNVKGQGLKQSVKALIKYLGKDNPDGSRSFKSTTFDFEQKGDSVTVRAKNGDAVLEDGVLSPDLSQQQLQALEQVQPVVDKYHQLEKNAQQNSESRGIHR